MDTVNPVEIRLELKFKGPPDAELISTAFSHPRLGHVRQTASSHRLLRQRRRSASLGSFKWTKGVKAVVVLLLRAAEWSRGSKSSETPMEEGRRRSLAATLNDVLTAVSAERLPNWVMNIFGLEKGASLLSVLLQRENPDFKTMHKAPVKVWLDTEELPPDRIDVIIDGKKSEDARTVALLADDVRRQWASEAGRESEDDARTASEKAAQEFAMAASRYRVRPIRSAQEFEEFWALDSTAYANIDQPDYTSSMYEVLRGWWQAFPPGAIVLFEASDLVGGIGIWPLSKASADGLKNGRLRERDLAGKMMRRFLNKATPYWYIGGIFVKQTVRGTYTSGLLQLQAYQYWALTCTRSITYPLELLALGVSKMGRNQLEKRGFSIMRDESQDGFPLYGRVLASADCLAELLQQ